MGNTLEHLLQIEAEAAALVNSAQEEANRRLRENEEKNRIFYEERLKTEMQIRQASLEKEKEKINEQYQKELNEYRNEIEYINADTQKFNALFNSYIKKAVSGEG
ncbi:MAG: hypothetical protein FWD40_12080 [Treponema sp.]|nr:hypothetical protein [Treponema sp.]